jgi:glycerol dehydrogenase-like iron-containing ADH family enzyme
VTRPRSAVFGSRVRDLKVVGRESVTSTEACRLAASAPCRNAELVVGIGAGSVMDVAKVRGA